MVIVEDDYLVGLEIEEALSEAGFQVVGVAHSADEALKLVAKQCPDLAIMDIRLAALAITRFANSTRDEQREKLICLAMEAPDARPVAHSSRDRPDARARS
jgi:DNA-binding NarL/FixJ family response regulator